MWFYNPILKLTVKFFDAKPANRKSVFECFLTLISQEEIKGYFTKLW